MRSGQVMLFGSVLRRWSCLLVLLFGTACSYGQSLKDLAFGADSTLEMMTWNVEHFPKAGFTTLDSVLLVVRSLDVDVIATQEISNRLYFDVLIDSLDGWGGAYADNLNSGLAYIFRESVISVDTVYEIYPNRGREFPRPPLVLEMRYGGSKYIVIDNHLKCCGNGTIDWNDNWDEEKRRLDASILLRQYINANFPNDRVVMLGDLNDLITDPLNSNVFQGFFVDSTNFRFVDMDLALGASHLWSFPSWPSHLDHLLVTDELFGDLSGPAAEVATIRIDHFLPGGFSQYDQLISDHRPVAFRIMPPIVVAADPPAVQAEGLSVYPNPVSGNCRIICPVTTGSKVIQILDVHGQVVLRQQLDGEVSDWNWDASQVATGVYFLRLQSNTETISGIKVIVLQ